MATRLAATPRSSSREGRLLPASETLPLRTDAEGLAQAFGHRALAGDAATLLLGFSARFGELSTTVQQVIVERTLS